MRLLKLKQVLTLHARNKTAIIIILAVVLILVFGVDRVLKVRRAHTSFENYYSFRGCTQLLQKDRDSGLCKTKADKIIKIVKFEDKWYLDGDLP